MALTKGVNSYLTVEEADELLAYRINNDAWLSADSTTKEKALITATKLIDTFNFVGQATGDSLAFPREGSYFDPKLSKYVILDDSVPNRVLDAVCEMALHLLMNPASQEGTTEVDSIKVDVIELTKIRKTGRTPPALYTALQPLLIKGGGMWWRAN